MIFWLCRAIRAPTNCGAARTHRMLLSKAGSNYTQDSGSIRKAEIVVVVVLLYSFYCLWPNVQDQRRPKGVCCIAWLGMQSFGTWGGSRKPLGMLVASSAPVSHALSTQEGDVALHSSFHCTSGEIAKMLAVALAVKNRSA